MSVSTRKLRKIAHVKRSLTATLMIGMLVFPFSSAQARFVRAGAVEAFDSIWIALDRGRPTGRAQAEGAQSGSPSERAARTQQIRLCPRKLSLHTEEGYTLVPVPLDQGRQTIHGAQMNWSSNNTSVASVASCGTVEAMSPGQAVITVQIGTKRASVIVEVEDGARSRTSEAEWDQEHAHDCDDPESLGVESAPAPRQEQKQVEASRSSSRDVRGIKGASQIQSIESMSIAAARLAAIPAVMRRIGSSNPLKATRASFSRRSTNIPLPQGGGFGEIFPQATFIENVVGSPRFSPVEAIGVHPEMKNNLGSSNYGFAAPVLSLGGRGVGINLSLIYNGQLWNKDTSASPPAMRFNYNKGMLAAGWNIGYGRIIRNYDGTATGDGSGVGSLNAPGNCLLVQGDGTRTHLAQSYDSDTQTWSHLSTNGLNTRYNFTGMKLRYNDGTLVRYIAMNNKLLPNQIETRNGDVIGMDYRQYNSATFPNRFSLDRITDTLGRIIQFYYYGDAGYPADPVNGKPLAALAAVTTPDLLTGQPRELIRVEYQDVTLQYDFNDTFAIDGPANSSPLTVVRRIYYPATGRGYLFLDYSSYGMCRDISMRKDMTGTGGAITDGTEIAYTKFNFPTVTDGELNRAPEYTSRKEWWQGHPNGTTPTEYTYSRSHGSSETDTVTETMPVTGTLLSTVTTSAGGQVSTIERKVGATVLGSQIYSYDFFDPSLLQSVSTTNEAGQTAATTFEYNFTDRTYGRVSKMYEADFGFINIRRTEYSYSNTSPHLSVNLTRLCTQIDVFDDQTNLERQKTVITYDDYSNGMQTYASIPSTHDSSFGTGYTKRGNPTNVKTFSSIAPSVFIPRSTKFDIFGNVVEAEVSCCQLKTLAFSLTPTWYSLPDTVTDGRIGTVPFQTTSFSYDFNTGLVTQTSDPNSQPTSFLYDSAWRLLTANGPSGASTTTKVDKDANGNDQLAYSQQVTYKEKDTDPSPQIITSKSWFDGAGRVIRSGSGAGSSPTSFDTTATQYDALGRVSQVSNPYLGDVNGIGTPTAWTASEYDNLSRVKKVTLPDQQTIQSDYNGSQTTVTDQVGRKRRSEVDGLGRLTKIKEQNPATGLLDDTNYLTTYVYDAIDNLTDVNQGGQSRSFVYDALSRMTSETTPEEGTVSFTYTDFSAMLKRTHSVRGVEAHFQYDSLNRLIRTWYTGLGGSDDPNASRPPLPTEVAATADVTISYNTAAPGNGQAGQITDGGGTESYVYDSLGRTTSKTRTIDGNSYQTQYQYNQASQLTLLIYPSGKRLRMNHDSRGRLNGEDKVDNSGNLLSKYVRSIGYNVAGQVTTLGIGEVGTNNVITETYGYSTDRLQPTTQTAVTNGGATLMSLNYGYQAAAGASGTGTTAGNSGQLMSITATINTVGRNETYTYDDLGRLASATGYYPQRNYSYDQWGNRTGVSGGSSQTVTMQQPGGGVTNNRIATVNGVGYTYDAAGNLTSDGVHSYKYDTAGRIANVDTAAASYSYDSANRRVKKVTGTGANAVTTYYIWEGSQVTAEYSNAPAGSGGTSYYLADKLSTRMITDSNGAFKGKQDHLPFGEEGGTSGTPEKHRFTSYERDSESGTDYAVNRQHSFSIGRFMQPDPVQGSIANPQSLNRYSYTLNDPINLSDPLGLYEGCVHQAMTEFLAKLSGRFSDSVARQLGQAAGDGPGGADSFRYAATNPWNAFIGFLGLGPAARIHFASPEQLGKEKRAFAGYITDQDYQSAGFVLHSIEDVHGAHLGFELGFGHLFAGHEPDRIIGDAKFVNVSNEVLQFLTGDSSVKLTPAQLNDLIEAIKKECGAKKAGELKITRPPVSPPLIPFIGPPPDSGGFSGPYPWPRYFYPDPPPPPSDVDRLA